MFRYLLLVACISFGGCSSKEMESILERIPEIIENFCPGDYICHENRSSPASEKTFRPGFESCCTECSCGTECLENGNCCFPYKQPYQNDDSNGLDDLQIERDCLFPSSVQPKEDRQQFQTYSMVSAVHGNVHGVRKSVSSFHCGDENVAPWGSLYPVYSAKHKQIYKNMVCASALGVTDGILWDAVLVCGSNILYQTDVSTSVLGLDSNSTPEYCTVDFIYPDDIENLQSLICYVSPINTCSDTEFQIPDGTGISKNDIIDLCTSGFLSPYRADKLYANVFCHICNAERFYKEIFCRELVHIPGKALNQRGFVGLIDDTFIQSNQKENFGNGPENPMACSFTDTSRCRPVLCPSGQLRDFTGKCKYPNKLWYDQEYTVLINLTSEEAISVTNVFHDKEKVLSALKSPWPKNWLVAKIYNELVDERRNYTSLIVTMKITISSVRPQNIMQRVKKIVMQDWLLQMNNATFVLKSTISVSTTIYKRLNVHRETRPTFGNYSINFTLPRYHQVYTIMDLEVNEHLVTKLYLCHQVELIQPNFILSSDNTMLFNTVTQRVMFDGEFVLISSNSVDDVRARICIEDSGMYQMDKNELPNACSFCNIFVLRLTIALLMSGAMYSPYIF